ncbi:MAG TPA: D-glycero-beta-D-manno-heptose-1,7-bisphosphate 7-phosphatase [Deltaproteobacteria bacterium]|nr:D-glycero-beta-D-manno-heptose-1,7-bisphosphate 7-phosphatase [Deltaproteobacteria bacterium]
MAVFLDRDGTINEDTGYLHKPEELVIINGAAEAIKRLNSASVMVVVVSNQSGVGRGYFTDSDVEAVNKRLIDVIGAEGARVDAIYYCNHHPDEDCGCRKPSPGMLNKATEEHGIDIRHSYVVGDKGSDIELALNAGAKGVLVLTGKGQDELQKLKRPAGFVAEDLTGAVLWILDDLKRRGASLPNSG